MTSCNNTATPETTEAKNKETKKYKQTDLDPELFYSYSSDGTIIGPYPRDEQHRKQLLAKINKAMDQGHQFCLMYLSEFIFVNPEDLE